MQFEYYYVLEMQTVSFLYHYVTSQLHRRAQLFLQFDLYPFWFVTSQQSAVWQKRSAATASLLLFVFSPSSVSVEWTVGICTNFFLGKSVRKNEISSRRPVSKPGLERRVRRRWTSSATAKEVTSFFGGYNAATSEWLQYSTQWSYKRRPYPVIFRPAKWH